jgi:hypothetical protein
MYVGGVIAGRLGNRCMEKIKNNGAVLLDFSNVLLLYLTADKVLEACPLSLNWARRIPLRRVCLKVSEPQIIKKNDIYI